MRAAALIHLPMALALAPLLPGIINKTKAWFAGRRGPPLLQLYFDLAKLWRKGAVYSTATTWIFRFGPAAGLAGAVTALAVLPLGDVPALAGFPGDLLLFAGALGLVRFATVVAALDTASSFEGMGASREVLFALYAEPALLLGLAALARLTGHLSLTDITAALNGQAWAQHGPAVALLAVALLIILLAESCRIPVDDPNTHLELTMIHEVMVLDHGGPDLALILYGAALKMWALGALLVGLLPLQSGVAALDALAGLLALGALAVVIGVIESVMARLRLLQVPHLVAGAGACAVFALIMVMR